MFWINGQKMTRVSTCLQQGDVRLLYLKFGTNEKNPTTWRMKRERGRGRRHHWKKKRIFKGKRYHSKKEKADPNVNRGCFSAPDVVSHMFWLPSPVQDLIRKSSVVKQVFFHWFVYLLSTKTMTNKDGRPQTSGCRLSEWPKYQVEHWLGTEGRNLHHAMDQMRMVIQITEWTNICLVFIVTNHVDSFQSCS